MTRYVVAVYADGNPNPIGTFHVKQDNLLGAVEEAGDLIRDHAFGDYADVYEVDLGRGQYADTVFAGQGVAA